MTTQFVDITPKWEGLVLTLAQLFAIDGNKLAELELIRMAQLADLYVETQKAKS
jgi:hypothetical protein